MKTHITAPCPMACAAINRKRKMGTAKPPQLKKKAAATNVKETIYPIEPINKSNFRPNLSYLIDRLGRKLLLLIGSIGYIVSLTLVAAAFFFNWGGLAVPIFLFLFIAAHAIGQGAVIWVFISEVWPDHLRASGQSLSLIHISEPTRPY